MALLRIGGAPGRTRAGAPMLAAPANVAAGSTGTTTPDPNPGTASYVRGRPIISGGTVKTEIGTLIRGGTMGFDQIGSVASTYAKNRANWQIFRDLGLNLIRLPFSLSLVNVSLSAQLAELDVAIDNGAATGMYCMPMFDSDYGTSRFSEMLDTWPTICARYKDRTHVLFEMQNEPHWCGNDYTSGDLDSMAQIYKAMRQAAPDSLIVALTPASLERADGTQLGSTGGLIAAVDGLVSRGCDVGGSGKGVVGFHAYGYYSRDSVSALKAKYPCMLTETVSGGPNNHTGNDNEVFKITEMEAVGVSWQVLQARFGEKSNTDTPYSNDEKTLTDRVLPDVHSAGITWSADPLTSSTTPTTGSGGGTSTTPAIVSITGDIANAVVGQTTTLTVTATGMTAIQWVIVASDYSWRTDPAVVQLSTAGTCTIAFVPIAGGDFVKVMSSTDQSVYLDSAAVPAQASSGGGTSGGRLTPSTTVPTDATWLEEFSGNNSGKLNLTWGDASLVSYSNGIMRIAGRAGHPDRSAVGVQGLCDGAEKWFGVGLYQVRQKTSNFLGAGDGSCSLLWPADNIWPGGEEDMGEWWNGEGPYFAHHWKDQNGDNQYEPFFIRHVIPDYDPSSGFHTYSTLLENGKISFYLDTTLVGSSTNNVTPVYAYGGVNRALGAMNRSNETWIEVDWMSFTAL